jgi:hypothetical protein
MHAFLLIVRLMALASPTKAPSAEEQRLYDEGTRAFQSGDARAAERAWMAGYGIARDPAFLVHVAEAEEKAGAPGEAAETYRRYLREAPDASDRADIEQRIARLAPAAAPPTPAPGPAEQTGEFGGTPPGTAPPAVPPAQRSPVVPGVDAEGPPAHSLQPGAPGWNRYSVTAFVATGAAVLLLGTAALFAAQAASDADDVNRLLRFREDGTGVPDTYSAVASQYERAMADGPRHDRYAKAALIGAAGATVVATAFFILDAKLTPEATVAIAPTGTGLGAIGGWAWRF